MTKINLNQIGQEPVNRIIAIRWLIDHYGLPSYDTWYLKSLEFVFFKNPKHATYFIMKFS